MNAYTNLLPALSLLWTIDGQTDFCPPNKHAQVMCRF